MHKRKLGTIEHNEEGENDLDEHVILDLDRITLVIWTSVVAFMISWCIKSYVSN